MKPKKNAHSRSIEFPPVELMVRLEYITSDDLSPWIAAFRSVTPQHNEESYQRFLRDTRMMDAAARALQSFCQPLLKTLSYPGRWYCGVSSSENLIPPALVEGSNGNFLTAWDLAFLEHLHRTGPEGREWSGRLLPEALKHATFIRDGLPLVDPWSFWLHTEEKPSGPFTFKAVPMLLSAQRAGIKMDEKDITDPYHLIILHEAFTARAWRALAWALWCDEFLEEWQRWQKVTDRAERKAIAPAIPQIHYANALSPLETANKVSYKQDSFFLVDRDGKEMPLCPLGPAIPEQTLKTLHILAESQEWLPVAVERLVVHITRKCWEQFKEGNLDARVLIYNGGWEALTEAAEVHSKYRHQIPRIIAVLRSWKGLDNKQPSLVADYWEQKAAPGRKAQVRILVGEGLVPGYASGLPSGEGRWLLPILDVPTLVIPGVNPAKSGLLLNYRWELIYSLRRSIASEVGGINEKGKVRLTFADRLEAARKSGLSEREAESIDKVWIGDGSEAWLNSHGEGYVSLKDYEATKLLINASEQAKGRRNAALKHPKRKKVGD
jgi:hypothetical protein